MAGPRSARSPKVRSAHGVDISVFYATDFGELSPGGIRSFISAVGPWAPRDADITYVGMGTLAGPLPRAQDRFVSVGHADGTGRTNTQFTRALLHHRSQNPPADVEIFHRAEHAAFTPSAANARVLVLHGGSNFAWRARRSLFGATYPFLEAVAVSRSDVVLSVAPRYHWWGTRALGSPQPQSTTYDDVFQADPPPGQRERKRVTLVGRLVAEKRFELAIEAVAQLSGVSLDVFGDGPERAGLQRLAKERAVTATFHGMTSPAAIAADHRRGDSILVVCSRFEGFPVAVLEAAACAVPVVGLATPGVREVVETVGGLVARGPADLATVIRASLAGSGAPDPDDVRRRFGARVVGEKFWRSVVVRQVPKP